LFRLKSTCLVPEMIGVIDYGSGNFTSVCNAISAIGEAPFTIKRPEDLGSVDHVILPGVGAYHDCVSALKERGLFSPLQDITKGDSQYFLGICVGHQVLSQIGTEFKLGDGLGAVKGKTVEVEVSGRERLPHIGWNNVSFDRSSPLFKDIALEACFYFVHSFHLEADDQRSIIATTHHSKPITAAINVGKTYGVQFHPEKSQQNGLRLLKNFCELA